MRLNLSETEQEILCEELEELRAELEEEKKGMAALGAPYGGCDTDGALLYLSIGEMLRTVRKRNRKLRKLQKSEERGGQDVERKHICPAG